MNHEVDRATLSRLFEREVVELSGNAGELGRTRLTVSCDGLQIFLADLEVAIVAPSESRYLYRAVAISCPRPHNGVHLRIAGAHDRIATLMDRLGDVFLCEERPCDCDGGWLWLDQSKGRRVLSVARSFGVFRAIPLDLSRAVMASAESARDSLMVLLDGLVGGEK